MAVVQVVISCLLKDTHCTDLTNFIPSITHEVGLVEPDKSEQSEWRHLSSKVRQFTAPNTVLPRDDLYTDRLFGSGSIKPSYYALFPRTNDLQRKSSRKSSMLFQEVLWLDCILRGCRTLIPSCYNLLLHRHDLHQKAFWK